MTIHEHRLSVNGMWRACGEARKWAAQYQTAQEVWDNCPRVDWLFWWAARMGQHHEVARAAKDIADSVKHLRGAAAYAAAHDAARSMQRSLNMKIARRHLVCPWHES